MVLDGYNIQYKSEEVLHGLGFSNEDLNRPFKTFSGGWRMRVLLAKMILQQPSLLLLDEPTNHLDLEGILWLEKFLQRERISYLVVSHDRYFLENVCNKIIEINKCYPEGLFMSDGSLSDYMEKKEAFMDAQAKQEKVLNYLYAQASQEEIRSRTLKIQ